MNIPTLSRLTVMIIGDDPSGHFPYRSSFYITEFFHSLDLDYTHDGTTRRTWALGVLQDLQGKPASGMGISRGLQLVLESLLDPAYYVNVQNANQHEAAAIVNSALKPYNLKVILSPGTNVPKIVREDHATPSHEKIDVEFERTIVFTPTVFTRPSQSVDPKLISVMMPFSAKFNNVYKAIQLAAEITDMHVLRGDDIWKDSTFIQDIFDSAC